MRSTAKIITTVNNKKTEHIVETANLTLICHKNGMKVDVPEYTEINPQQTIQTISNLSEGAWRWNSVTPLYRYLWREAFKDRFAPDPIDIEVPETLAFLHETEMGIQHIAGLLLLSIEHMQNGHSIFWRTPETYIHPSLQGNLANVMIAIQAIFGSEPNGKAILTEVYKLTPKMSDKEQTILYLECNKQDQLFCTYSSKPYTYGEALKEVKENSEMGKIFTQAYCQMRDKK